jgi:DtxR family transcriptional regulator, Mn-dependent transcriptional regulator
MTISTENYLKAIVSHYMSTSEVIRTTQLSELLDITPASVTEMVKKLSEKKYIIHEPYKGIKLTKHGEVLGLNVLRRHRLLELFLSKCLDVSWDDVHEEAENLEHAVSDMLIDKIDIFLNYPKFDPHGDPIPQKDGNYPRYESVSILADIDISSRVQVVRISNDNKSFLNYITSIKCKLGSDIEIQKKYDFDLSMDIQIDSQIIHISEFVSQHIWVIPNKIKK